MMRRLLERVPVRDRGFRWRGRDISRIEGLSDAVFGFVITLLVVSLEVPRTSAAMLDTLRGVPIFALTFSVLFSIWHAQYVFFRRYGLDDNATVTLNAILLFLVMVLAYPLKFVFAASFGRLLGLHGTWLPVLEREHRSSIVLVFGLGWMAVFGVFALLYAYAYVRRHALELMPIETFETLESVRAQLMLAAAGLVALCAWALGVVPRTASWRWLATLIASAVAAFVIGGILYEAAGRPRRRRRFHEQLGVDPVPQVQEPA
jgi:uncharacterized membrane protein